MTFGVPMKGAPSLLKGWLLISGRDAVATTRASFVSVEGRAGLSVFVGLWLVGRLTGGGWNLWGPELGGETLAIVHGWYGGERVLGQAVLLVAHLLLGVLWGGIIKNAWAGIGHFLPRVRAERFTAGLVGVLSGFLILGLHGALWVRDLARHPALYQETVFASTPFGSWVHESSFLVMSNYLNGFVALGVSLIVGIALYRLVHRGVVWFMKFPRPTRMAIGVLGGALVLFTGGVRFVVWTQEKSNEGPNVIFLSIDGLRGDHFNLDEKNRPESLVRWGRSAQVSARAVPPSAELAPTLATALSGRSPLSHGIRHEFPAAHHSGLGSGSLPLWLRQHGYTTVLLADGPAACVERMGKEFEVARVAPGAVGARFFRRQLERSPHLLPYLSGWWGRHLPFLRGSPFLSDPHLLAGEISGVLKDLKHHSKFFLWAHFSSPGPFVPVVSPRAAARLAGEGSQIFRRPGAGWSDEPLSETDVPRVQRLYAENLREVKSALDRVIQSLAHQGLDRNTAVIVWSPRPTLLTPEEVADARALKGPAFFDAPLLVVPLPGKGGSRRFAGFGRVVDLAPTVTRLLDLPLSPVWEGVPLSDGLPPGEQGILYFETSAPLLGASTEPSRWERLVVEDREAPGHLRLHSVWEDPVLMFRDRAIQWGNERLIYHPEKTGVTFDYFNLTEDPKATRNLAGTRSEKKRVQELREVFYRYLSREAGWRPQNDYWIPEAFLREEEDNLLGLIR